MAKEQNRKQALAGKTDESGGLTNWLTRTARALAGSTISPTDYDPKRHDNLVTFDGLEGHEEVERYWVNAPFAFISINYYPIRSSLTTNSTAVR
jgi:flagellar protein FlaI